MNQPTAEQIIQKYNLNKSKWDNKGFHAALHYFYPVTYQAFQPMKRQYGNWHNIVLCFFKDNYANWFWNNADNMRLGKDIIAKVNADEKFLEKMLAKWHKLRKKFEQQVEKVNRTNLQKLSPAEFNQLYQEFFDAYVQQYGIAIGIQDPFNWYTETFMEETFRKFISSKGKVGQFNEIYAALLAPVLPSFVNEEKKSLFKILAAVQKNPEYKKIISQGFEYASVQLEEMPEIEKMLQRHAENFHWTQNNYAKIRLLNKLNFLEELCTLQKTCVNAAQTVREIESSLEKARINKAKLIAELNPPKELLTLIKITKIFTYMQDERKKNVLIANHCQRKFIEEAARRTGISPALLEYTVLPELKKMVAGEEADLKKLSTRRKSCLIVHTRTGHEVFEGEETEKVYQKLFGSAAASTAQVKGSCASKGKATGRAKIVLKTHDIVKMEEGDVLVTSMTRPEMVPAMKRACAIVTDEGGITSHAAIISRELDIPCIIATKTATRVFKDGDLIEVDANSGVARKVIQK